MKGYINKQVKDTDTGMIEKILETTSNSILVTQTKLSIHGINCSNWFIKKDFDNQFIVL